MIEYLKDKLRNWLFEDRLKELKAREAELVSRKQQIEKEYSDKALLHLVRRKYNSFNPSKLVKGQEDLLADMPKGEQTDFLNDMATVIENDNFRKLMEHLYTKQLISSALDGENIDAINFGRATINGLSIVEESLERYANIYYERSADESDYDEYSII